MKPILLVLAAGMGSRYGGVKQIDSVGPAGECLLDYGTFDAKKAGFGKVVFIIRHDIEKDFREKLFDRIARNFNAEYVFQSHESLLTQDQITQSTARTKPWGTLHAVLCARDAIDAPFAVINSDDYYGGASFATLGKYLSQLDNGSTEHAMVGYMLCNTMSVAGSVSRGICKVKNNKLVSIEEQTKIYYKDGEGSPIISDTSHGSINLSGNEWVSMNLFGFSPSIFTQFTQFWEEFIKKNATAEKSEALLPSAVGNIITQGTGSVNFFTTEEKWFGMTYSADRELVKRSIAQKISDGYYPKKLWEK